MREKRWIYDIEIYPNLFLLVSKNVLTKEIKYFQISILSDDREKFAKWILNEVDDMIGFNNLFYDYPVLHHLITKLWNLRGRDLTKKLYLYSKSVIKGKRTYFKKNDYVKPQIDLFKINHFDNKAKMTSLKLLEFNLRMRNILELPYPPSQRLSETEIKEVIEYCKNDVNATELVYNATLSEIELREKMSPKYNIDFTNFNSTKMGEYILVSKIIEQLGEHRVYDYVETEYGERRIIKNTKRSKIDLKKVIFDYISFTETPFIKLLQWFKNKVITETKNVFTNIPFEELEILYPYYRVEKRKGKQKNLNVVYKGFQYDFGVGGIHGSVDSGIYEEDDEYMIIDIDVDCSVLTL